jgi:hypothetical protein
MNLKSSPGIPWNSLRGIHSKKGLMVETGKSLINAAKQVTCIEPVTQQVLERLDLAKHRRRPFSLWKDCLKDETRPVAKVDAGKTRIFTAAPLDFTIATRVLLGRFKPIWKNNGLLLGHSVGIDCLSPQWGGLYRFLRRVSTYGFDCDFSSFDGNLRADFMRAAIRIIAAVIESGFVTEKYGLTKENIRMVVETLLDECVETIQQSGEVVWMSLHGNPSGNPLTTELNCLVNFMYHWFCFRAILGESIHGLEDYLNRVAFVAFGDDAVFTFQDVEEVTFEKLKYWMTYLGQTYTNAQKTTDDISLTSIEDLSFLKRKFKEDGSSSLIVMCPIEIDSITGQFNWCSYGEDSIDILRETYENSLIEIAQHGKEKFNWFVARLHDVVSNHLKSMTGQPVPRPLYRSYRAKLVQKLTK